MSETTRLQHLEDRQAISDLVSRYCYLIARRDVEGVIQLFTRDCLVEILDRKYEGEAGLRKLYAESLIVDPKPYVHNLLVEELTDRSARSRAVFEIEAGPTEKRTRSTGSYEDHFVKVESDWKFARRTFHVY